MQIQCCVTFALMLCCCLNFASMFRSLMLLQCCTKECLNLQGNFTKIVSLCKMPGVERMFDYWGQNKSQKNSATIDSKFISDMVSKL